MQKVTGMLTVLVAVSALTFSATLALAVNWDGGGDGVNWSDNGEFSGDGWGNWDADPTAGVDLTLNTPSTSVVDISVNSWGTRPNNVTVDGTHTLIVTNGGLIDCN